MRANLSLRLSAAALLGAVACGVDGNPVSPMETKPDAGAEVCSGSEIVAQKRVVRLTFNQQTNTIAQIFGANVAADVRTRFDIKDASQRTFPPLANAREGSVITDGHFLTNDNIAQYLGAYVHDNFTKVTACQADDDACAQKYVLDIAARAFRHPLDEAEKTALLSVYSGVISDGGSSDEGVEYGIYAAFISPQFLYRTELGSDPKKDGAITDTELASALSFFVADAPPDDELMAAATAGTLTTADGMNTQVDRLLRSAGVQRNLEAAILAYFQIGALETVVIDPKVAPSFDEGMRNSMLHESELFIRNTLWPDKLTGLLTSRKSVVNARLAKLYDIPFPPANVTVDADGFAPVELPETRAGLITLAGFLTSRSRPDQQSVVGRGLAVNAAFLCVQNPPFPSNLADTIANVNKSLADKTEREKAEYRASTGPCSGCHPNFDPYGLALDNFSLIGEYREVDAKGRAIDPAVSLPPAAGNVDVANAREMAEALAKSDAFVQCMTKNVLAYALAEGGVGLDSCATSAVVKRFKQTDGSFASLVSEIAAADAFRIRTVGGTTP